jgi:hypothetical protein
MGISSNPQSVKPDLFSALQRRDTPSPLASDSKPSSLRTVEPAAAASSPYALPTNLPSALRHLNDEQLDRLLAAVLAERQGRGRKRLSVSDEPRRKRRTKEAALPLAQGKLKCVAPPALIKPFVQSP